MAKSSKSFVIGKTDTTTVCVVKNRYTIAFDHESKEMIITTASRTENIALSAIKNLNITDRSIEFRHKDRIIRIRGKSIYDVADYGKYLFLNCSQRFYIELSKEFKDWFSKSLTMLRLSINIGKDVITWQNTADKFVMKYNDENIKVCFDQFSENSHFILICENKMIQINVSDQSKRSVVKQVYHFDTDKVLEVYHGVSSNQVTYLPFLIHRFNVTNV